MCVCMCVCVYVCVYTRVCVYLFTYLSAPPCIYISSLLSIVYLHVSIYQLIFDYIDLSIRVVA